jgi:hypothetical protein
MNLVYIHKTRIIALLLTCSYCGKDIHSGKLSPQSFLRSSLPRDPRALISAACKMFVYNKKKIITAKALQFAVTASNPNGVNKRIKDSAL